MIYVLSDAKVCGAISLPVISTNFLDIAIDIEFNALVFTSKNAVRAFAAKYPNFMQYPTFVVGESTAKEVVLYNGRVTYLNDAGYAKDLAIKISNEYSGYKFLWPRAKEVAFELGAYLRELNEDVNEIIIYETLCKKQEQKPCIGATIIFSAPSTVKCFINNFGWDSSYGAVALGKTTSNALNANKIEHLVSPKRNLQEAVNFILEKKAQKSL